MTIIVFDVETTGLLVPIVAGAHSQPRLIELNAVRLTGNLEASVESLHVYVNPQVAMPDDAFKVHGIRDEFLADKPLFSDVYNDIARFFCGATCLVGHNIMFDKLILYYELVRLDKQTQFPWPYKNVCTAEISLQIKGYRMALGDMFVELVGEAVMNAHSAPGDVEMTRRIFKRLCENGTINIGDLL